MSVDAATVRRIAHLARIAVAESEVEHLQGELNAMLAFVEQLEHGTIAGKEIAQWRQRLASGQGKFSEMAAASRVFPPLFVWTVAQSGEDLTAGFQRAAELYQARTVYRSELLLYSFLPCSVLALATMILIQLLPVFGTLTSFLSWIGDGCE